MKTVVLCLLIAGLAAGCARTKLRPTFDGQQFRASASKDGESRAMFAVKVRPASASLDGAIEAGQYEGIRYCINQFGTSAIDWADGADPDPETLVVENDALTLRGVCDE